MGVNKEVEVEKEAAASGAVFRKRRENGATE